MTLYSYGLPGDELYIGAALATNYRQQRVLLGLLIDRASVNELQQLMASEPLEPLWNTLDSNDQRKMLEAQRMAIEAMHSLEPQTDKHWLAKELMQLRQEVDVAQEAVEDLKATPEDR